MSIKHSWNGTTLTVVSDSGTSAADLKGDRGDTGPRGPQGPAGIVYDEQGNIVMEGYATEEYVDYLINDVNEKIENVDVDLTGYATEEYVDNAVSNVEVDLTGYATEQHVAEELAKAQLEGAGVDTTNFAMKSDIPEVDGVSIVINSDGKLSSALGGGVSGYVYQEININQKLQSYNFGENSSYPNALPFVVGTNYTVKLVLDDGTVDRFHFTYPKVDSDTSTLTQIVKITDSEYIDSITFWSGHELYFTLFGIFDGDYELYVKDIYIAETGSGEFGDDGVYSTINPYVIPVDNSTVVINSDGKLSALAGGTVELGNYYTKAEVDRKLPNIDTYATKEYVSEEIAKAQLEDVDLSDYATKSYVDNKIRYGTSNLTAGSTYYPSGWLYVVYE